LVDGGVIQAGIVVGSLGALGAAVAAVAAGAWLGRLMVRRQAEAWSSGIRSVTRAIAAAAKAEQAEILRGAELAAREEALAAGAANEAQSLEREGDLVGGSARLRRREEALSVATADLDARRARLGAPRQRAEAREAEATEMRRQARALEAEAPAALERGAGQTVAALRARLIEAEIEDARMASAQLVRAADQIPPDDAGRRAKRIMGIAVGRFSGHYLTERLMSLIPLPQGAAAEPMIGRDEVNLRAIEGVAGVKLSLSDARDSIRLEGLDGVGREVARRCMTWLGRNPNAGNDPKRVEQAARDI
jgi:ribonuclease Y